MFFLGLAIATLAWISLPLTFAILFYLLDYNSTSSFLIALVPFAILKVTANLITGMDG